MNRSRVHTKLNPTGFLVRRIPPITVVVTCRGAGLPLKLYNASQGPAGAPEKNRPGRAAKNAL